VTRPRVEKLEECAQQVRMAKSSAEKNERYDLRIEPPKIEKDQKEQLRLDQ
jgi:hypothetical protein